MHGISFVVRCCANENFAKNNVNERKYTASDMPTAVYNTHSGVLKRHSIKVALLAAVTSFACTSAVGAESGFDDINSQRTIQRHCPHELKRMPNSLPPPRCNWAFRDATRRAGLDYEHGFTSDLISEKDIISGGVAAGDYDSDGDVDLYVVTGDIGPNLLYRNRGNGRFKEVASHAGVSLEGHKSSGPIFADVDGDGNLDLLVGGTSTASLPVLFLSNGDGSFRNVTATHLPVTMPALNAAFGDIDRDGDLDLVLAHWGETSYGTLMLPPDTEILWRNNGDGVFEDWSVPSGVTGTFALEPVVGDVVKITDLTFTPNFTDLNDDGWPDLVLASDFGSSKVLMNQAGVFWDATNSVISDENGMGGTVGDFDNDGDMDWFVSSIYDFDQITKPGQNWGVSGNRLYRNDGQGNFSDATDEAGVRRGFWGWGSCFADFDNDGHLDLAHVNGFPIAGTEFDEDPTRLFMNNRDGTFLEQSVFRNMNDRGQGRGVVCFDADRDGDLDLFIANNGQPGRYFRNDGGNRSNFFNVRLHGPPGNTQGIGATVWIENPTRTLRRDIRAGSNFVSQDPAEAHFGLGVDKGIKRLRIKWPDGEETVMFNLKSNQHMLVRHPSLKVTQ